MEVLRVEKKKIQERESESQEDQDITRLVNFIRTQEKRREGVFVCFGMKERGGLYSSGGENINGRLFNEG